MAKAKFKLTDEFKTVLGTKLFRIEATASFGNVNKGDKGGWVEKESNLSQDGNAWVYGNAEVSGDARVSGNAWVSGNARVYGDAEVSGNAWVYGNAKAITGYWFAHKNPEWDVTEVKMEDGWVTLVKDYREPEEDKETIDIGGKTYEVTDELKDALKNLKEA